MLPIRISAVSYLNTKPFIYGIEHSDLFSQVELSLDNPAVCAEKLLKREADIGLVPVAILPKLNSFNILSDFCIASDNEVSSVKLYSDVPLSEIKTVWLDYQSHTSVTLVRLLAKHFWKITPEFKHAQLGYEQKISGTTAGVVIGDRTFELNNKFNYQFDLAGEWNRFTQLPFVFACWISSKELPTDFVKAFNLALMKGVEAIPLLSKEINQTQKYNIDVLHYLSRNLSYFFDAEKRKAMNTFLNYIADGNRITLSAIPAG